MNQDNLYKKLRIICLILAIICMGLSLIKKAKASEAESVSDFSNYIYDIYNSCNVTTEYTDNYMNEVFQNAKNFVHLYNNDEHILVFGNKDYLTTYYGLYYGLDTINHKVYGNNNTYGYYLPKYPRPYSGSTYAEYYVQNPVPNINECIVYYIYLNENEIICSKVLRRGSASFQNITNSPNYSVSRFNDKYTMNNNDGTYSLLNVTGQTNHLITDYYSFGNNCYGQYNGSTYCYNLPEYYTDDMLNPPATNTNGFNIYKTTKSGKDYIVFDALKAVPSQIRNLNWYLTYLTSGLTFDLYIDDVLTSISYTFDIDDASEDYPYNGNYFKWQDDYGNLILRWEIPFDDLNIGDSTSVYINNVIFLLNNELQDNNITIPYAGVFVYPQNFYLYGIQEDSGLLDPDNVVPDTPELNPVDNTTKEQNLNAVVYGSMLAITQSQYSSWLNNLHPGTIYQEYIYNQSNLTITEWLQQWPSLVPVIGDWYEYYNGIQTKTEFKNRMYDVLKDFAYSQTTDYVIFIFTGNDAFDGVEIYVFDTTKGRMNAVSWLLNSQNTYWDKYFDVASSYAAFVKKKVDTIDKNLFNFASNTYSQNNSIIAGLANIDKSINDLSDYLKNMLKKILEALQGLNIDIPEADYSSITSRLDQIISNQGSGNLNSDWYQNYRSWLYAQDSTDNIISPHEFFIEIFDPIKNTYDAFVNNNSIAGYIADMDLFVEYLSGKIDDNLSIYFKDSIGSPSFDINDNTMLTAGGIQ